MRRLFALCLLCTSNLPVAIAPKDESPLLLVDETKCAAQNSGSTVNISQYRKLTVGGGDVAMAAANLLAARFCQRKKLKTFVIATERRLRTTVGLSARVSSTFSEA